MGDTFETFERGCGAPLARRNRIQAAIAALLLAGCCSYDPAALGSADVDDRREALACLGVLAEEDATIRAEARAAALNHLDPEVERNPAVRSTAVRVLEQVEAGQDAPAADVVDALSGRVTATGEHLRIRADALSALGRLATADPKVEVLLRRSWPATGAPRSA